MIEDVLTVKREAFAGLADLERQLDDLSLWGHLGELEPAMRANLEAIRRALFAAWPEA